MNITEQDTFDTLKHGYIPITNLMEYVKEQSGFPDYFDHFHLEENDEDINIYVFKETIQFLTPHDYYEICCYILEPDNDERTNTEMWFTLDLNLPDEEFRSYPPFDINISECQHITTREQFYSLILEWDEFVGHCYLTIMSHLDQCIEDIDKIVKTDQEWYGRSNIKQQYIKRLNEIPIQLMNIARNIRILNNTNILGN
jgi:hypothetical protein